MKPSDSRWLPPLLQTLSQLYESSRDAEAYGTLLASVNGVQAVISYRKFSVPLLS